MTLTLEAFGFGLASGIGYALYSIFSKLALRRYNTLTITAYTFYFAAIAALPRLNHYSFSPCLQICVLLSVPLP